MTGSADKGDSGRGIGIKGRYVLSSAINGDIQYLRRLKHFIRRPIKSTHCYSAKPNSALPNERRNINHACADESQGGRVPGFKREIGTL